MASLTAAAPNSPADRAFLPVLSFFIVFCAIEATAMAGLYAYARSGLETDGAAILGLLPLCFAVMSVGLMALKIFAGGFRAPLALALAVTATMLFPMTGGLLGPWMLLPMIALAAVGLLAAVRESGSLIRAHPLTLILGAPALALVRFVAINGGQMTHIYAPEYMLLGQPYLDTSFHAALAEMLRNFGVVSVGLDGLVPQFHHFGSHVWLGAVSDAFGLPVIELYPMAFQIFAVPSFTCFFLYAAAYLVRRQSVQPVLLIVAGLIATFVSSWFFLDKLLLSESNLFSLILFLSAVPLLFAMLSREETSPAAFWTCVGLSLALGVVMLIFKIPTGVMWAAAVAVVSVRRLTAPRWQRTVLVMVALTIAGAAAILILVSLVSSRSLWSYIDFFDFAGGSTKYFLSDLAFGLLAAAAVAFSRVKGSYKRGDAAGLLAILIVLGALPGTIFALSNTAYYFINTAAWLALVVVTGQLALLLQSAANRRRMFYAGAIALLVVVVAADPDRYKRLSIYLQRVAALQEYGRDGDVDEWPQKRSMAQSFAVIGKVGGAMIARATRLEQLFPDEVAAALASSPGGVFVRRVNEARAAGPGRLAVFVPPTNAAFWTMTRDCRAQPFLIPAMTGVPMLLGLHPKVEGLGCELDTTYGLGQYNDRSHSIALEPDLLCGQALERGFSSVLVLESPDRLQDSRVLACGP